MKTGGKLAIGCGILAGLVVIFALILVVVGLTSYNKFVTLDENVNQTWAQVQNVYQRRYDLIPNLVETVKGYATHERETFQAVTEARSKAGGTINLQAEDLTAQNLARFQQAQSGLGGALSRLLVVLERYPDLKANQNFLQLQTQLEGTENRIAVERRRFNEAVQAYNQAIRRFPAVLIAGILGFNQKPYFEAETQAQEAPKVEF